MTNDDFLAVRGANVGVGVGDPETLATSAAAGVTGSAEGVAVADVDAVTPSTFFLARIEALIAWKSTAGLVRIDGISYLGGVAGTGESTSPLAKPRETKSASKTSICHTPS